MSSVAAELNSLATASTMDFYKRHFRKDGDEKSLVAFGRLVDRREKDPFDRLSEDRDHRAQVSFLTELMTIL